MLMLTTVMLDATFVSSWSRCAHRSRYVPESKMLVARLAVGAQPPVSDLTNHLQGRFGAHTRRPMFATCHPSGALVPSPLTLQPAVRFCAGCLAAVPPSARVSLPKSGCPCSAHQVLASHHMISSVKLGLVWKVHPAPGIVSLHFCRPIPSRPLSVALFSPDTPHVSSLSGVQAARASSDHSSQRQSRH